jgi:thiol-disulfide isomerase/thioredoxin
MLRWCWRYLVWSLMCLVLAACATGGQDQMEEPTPVTGEDGGTGRVGAAMEISAAKLRDLGAAPEMTNEVWLNTEQPLRLADLRGKVVLLDMWTFGCINCQHVIPSLRRWYDTYSSQGLVVIGNHYPEFGYEKDLGNLKEALVRLDVPYPVAQDNEGKTWSAYRNHYWPTLYLIDKRGHLRYQHIGEGAYQETEAAIQALLAEKYP